MGNYFTLPTFQPEYPIIKDLKNGWTRVQWPWVDRFVYSNTKNTYRPFGYPEDDCMSVTFWPHSTDVFLRPERDEWKAYTREDVQELYANLREKCAPFQIEHTEGAPSDSDRIIVQLAIFFNHNVITNNRTSFEKALNELHTLTDLPSFVLKRIRQSAEIRHGEPTDAV
jgi:hypothetical protein